jgi:hypothetical protein
MAVKVDESSGNEDWWDSEAAKGKSMEEAHGRWIKGLDVMWRKD